MQEGETVGALLKRTREERSLSVEDVSKELNMKSEHIEAMESDTILNFLPAAYARGFVKGYAEFLELDHHAVAEEFDKLYRSEIPRIHVREIGPIIPVERRPRRSKGILHYSLYVLLIAAIVAFYFVFKENNWFRWFQREKPTPVEKTTEDDSSKEKEPSEEKAPEQSNLILELRFVQNTRVAYNADGSLIPSKYYGAGTTETFRASKTLVLDIDEAEKVEVYLDGRIQSIGTGKIRLTLDKDGLKKENISSTGNP